MENRIVCENITGEIIQNRVEEGYKLVFQELVMEHNLKQINDVKVPYSISFKCWANLLQEEFFNVYEASFSERPGFPGWSMVQWVNWTSNSLSFRPDTSYLAIVEKQNIGFITSDDDEEFPDKHGHIIQVGVIPQWRKHGVAAALINKLLEVWKKEGKTNAYLHVNQNNPSAISLYENLGFTTIRLRGAFEKNQV